MGRGYDSYPIYGDEETRRSAQDGSFHRDRAEASMTEREKEIRKLKDLRDTAAMRHNADDVWRLNKELKEKGVKE
ncbi:MAG: hypothetical protein ABIH21_01785 [Patescibacteria group bacterium]